MKIILASGSPRRKELLNNIGIKFDVIPSNADETLPASLTPAQAVEYLSKTKAHDVFLSHPDCAVIGSDTVVACDGKILGKPKNETDAFKMLKMLSGKTHSVFTGVTIMTEDETVSFYEETKVTFYELTDDEINSYIKTGEPMDKAGAYGIQGKGCVLVKKIDGDYFNVVGLPAARTYRELKYKNII